MAIQIKNTYSGRTDNTDTNYPYGKGRNVVGGVEGTGTPFEADWYNNLEGFLQGLLLEAGVTPDGDVDNANSSQLVEAVKGLGKSASKVSTKTDESVQDFVDSFALKIFQSPTNGGLTEIQTRTVNAGEVYEVRKTSDDSLATIYSDSAGTTEIVQNGTSNVSDSAGVVGLFVADGDYYVEVGGDYSRICIGDDYNSYDTVSDYKNSKAPLKIGSVVNLLDRGGEFLVVAGSSGGNDMNIISNINTDQSLDLKIRNGEARLESFGYSGSATNNAAIVNHALSLTSVSTAVLPKGLYSHTETVTIPNNKGLVGSGTGFASNYITKVLYEGVDGSVAFQFEGFYTRFGNFVLDDPNRLNSEAIKFGSVKTRHYISDLTITGFAVGIRNSHDLTSFTHVLENVYIKDCRRALWFKKCNNLILKSCFIESNDIGFDLDTIFNLVISDGTVLEIFGDERLSETNKSVLFKLTNSANIVIRDSYVEVGTLASAGTQVQIAQLTNVKGFTYVDNYHNRSAVNMLPHIEFMDDNSSGVTIRRNYFLKGNSTGTDYIAKGASGFDDVTYKYDIGGNVAKFSMLDKPIKFDPILREAGAEIVGVTYNKSELSCITDGNICTINFNLALSSKGSSTAGALTLDIPVTSLAGQGGDAEIIGSLNAKFLSASFTDFSLYVESGFSRISFVRDFTTALSSANLTDTTILRGQITFPLDRPDIQ